MFVVKSAMSEQPSKLSRWWSDRLIRLDPPAAGWRGALVLGLVQFGLLLVLFIPFSLALSEGRNDCSFAIIMATMFSFPAVMTGGYVAYYGMAAFDCWQEGDFLGAKKICLRCGFWCGLFNFLPLIFTLEEGLDQFLIANLIDLGLQTSLVILGIGLWLPRNEAEKMKSPEA